MIKGYKYRIYPNVEQRQIFERHFGAMRWIYNWGLETKNKSYVTEGKLLSYFDLQKRLPELKRQPETKWLKEINSQSIQLALRHLDNAFTQFFRSKRNKPRFKNRHTSRKSFTLSQGTVVDFSNSVFYGLKIPRIKTKFSREFRGKIKQTTILRTSSNKYYVSFRVDVEEIESIATPIIPTTSVGLDLGLNHFITLSSGEKLDNPRFLKKSLAKLKAQQRKLSRKKKGSNNRNKQRIKVARCYEKVANQRADFLQKLTTRLIRENQVDTFCIEDLNIEGMVKNRKLSRSISDASWGEFVRILTYKSAWYGKNIVKIGRFDPSSKLCSVCGTTNRELELKDRVWTCSCGATHDRDINAAKNIKNFALQRQNLIGSDRPE